jgi:conjugative transfer pilus assembly protein TraH
MRKKDLHLILVAFLLECMPVQASIETELQHFFESAGMQSQVNQAGAYEDQSAGYYTGGSLVVRNQVKNAQPAMIQMPGFRAGCGGIDAWAGGISHITSQEIVNMLRNIGSSTASYAFLLALETVSPMIYNIMNELNALATKVNHLNISSCETAATMLGGLWPKSDQSSKHLCQAMGSNLGKFSDWSAARQGCGAKGDRESVFREKGSDPAYKDMLVGEFNLSWKALRLNQFLIEDRPLAELFMTLVGSIISRKKDNGYEPIHLLGYADKDNVLKGLLEGGNTPIYHCDEVEKCLNPRLVDTMIPQSHALLRKVHNTLEVLVNKIYNDEEITPEEKGFLNATRLPVYKMLNVSTAYRQGAAPLNIHQYSDLIALDILYKYILEVIDIVHDGVTQLESIQVDNSKIEIFLNGLRTARERITIRRNSAFQQMDSVLSFIEATQLLEKQLHTMMGGVANESNWF